MIFIHFNTTKTFSNTINFTVQMGGQNKSLTSTDAMHQSDKVSPQTKPHDKCVYDHLKTNLQKISKIKEFSHKCLHLK